MLHMFYPHLWMPQEDQLPPKIGPLHLHLHLHPSWVLLHTVPALRQLYVLRLVLVQLDYECSNQISKFPKAC
jgi:hypothetical protein